MIEGTGTKADLAVEPDRDSNLQHRDLAMQAALELLCSWQPPKALLEIR